MDKTQIFINEFVGILFIYSFLYLLLYSFTFLLFPIICQMRMLMYMRLYIIIIKENVICIVT